ncbi:organomercurial lyase [Kitasatospora sp. NPDC056327]|uniref:organomercurial lyase n=1 Tax=Kitasatospora sp. NPDC056327 TaxID=3345785 RepID=UPI0035DF26D2
METEKLRLAVYRTFAATGRAPGHDRLAEELGTTVPEVRAGLRRLADARHLALGPDDAVVLAHPFSAVPLGFSVMAGATLWFGGCAWDSFALPHLVPGADPALVATTCPACDRPHAWTVTRQAPPEGAQVAHFLVPAARMWDDVVHTCAHQRLFCSADCVDDWLAATGNPRGAVLDLATLWRLAAHWYDGRLGSPYTRREPAAAAGHLRSVGLSGEFWGL